MLSRFLLSVLLTVIVSVLAACSGTTPPPIPKEVTVKVTVSEYKFELDPPVKEFSVGTVYHFQVTNKGTVGHDWMIMPRSEMDESKALASIEDDDLKPGVTLTKDYTFKPEQAGNYEFACHVAGHYEKGMKYVFTVK